MSEAAAPRAEVYRTRDLAGWDVTDREGTRIGDLSDLLIGADGAVRYLAVNLGLFRKQVLVPAGAVEWGRVPVLVVTRWTAEQVKALPAYDPALPLTPPVLEEMARAHPRFYGGGVDEGGEPRAVPLKEAREFRLSADAPDVRGWTVFGSDHERLGSIREMLVDPVAMKVRFVAVDVAEDLYLLKEDRRVIVPMHAVELRPRGQDAWVSGATAAQLAALPAYTGGPVEPWLERAVEDALGGASAALPGAEPSRALPPPLPDAAHPADPAESVDPLDPRDSHFGG